jgi:hypothetical protein
MRDLKSNISVVNSILPQSLTAAANGTGVDLQGADRSVVIFHAGATGGTTPSFTFAVQESDDNSTFADVAAADLQGTAPVVTTTNSGMTVVGYVGAKRYIRAIAKTVTGTSPTLLASACVVKSSLNLRGGV